jgi:hypothetical protein
MDSTDDASTLRLILPLGDSHLTVRSQPAKGDFHIVGAAITVRYDGGGRPAELDDNGRQETLREGHVQQ